MPQPPITDLDQGFVGVNGRTDPALTQQGLVSSAKNRRFIKGVATTRRGVKILPWSNKASGFYENVAYATGDIVRFSGLKIEGGTGDAATVITTPAEAYNGVTPNADPDGPSSNRLAGPYFERTSLNSGSSQGQLPVTAYNTSGPAVTVNTSYWTDKGALVFKYGTVYGAGVFRTPNDIEWLVVATTTGVFITQENNASEELKVDGKTYAASADSTHYTDLITGSHDRVTFVQCFEKLIMFRGKDDAPLELSEDLAAGFKIVGKEESEDVDENPNGTGLESIPNADTGVYFGNRLVVPHGRDEIAVSDYLNYTAFEPTRSSLRVNVGSSDSLKAVFKFDPLQDGFGLCSAKSVWRLGWGLPRSHYGSVRAEGIQEFSSGRQGSDLPVRPARCCQFTDDRVRPDSRGGRSVVGTHQQHHREHQLDLR